MSDRIKKMYKCLRASKYLIKVKVAGGTRIIHFNPFTSGSENQMGVYVTDKPSLQEALEKHPSFGKKFYLVGGGQQVSKQVDEEGAITITISPLHHAHDDMAENKVKVAQENSDNEDDLGTAPNPKSKWLEIPGVVNSQQAKTFLQRQLQGKVLARDLNNMEAIKKVAAENMIRFPEWEARQKYQEK